MPSLRDIDLLKIGDTIQLAGAVYSHEDKAFVCLFPEDHDVRTLPVEWLEMDDEDWKTFLRQTDLLETEVLAKASNGTLAKAIIRKSARQIEQRISWAVFRRDKYTCRYCGNDQIPLTVDHLVRWEEGGPSIEANLLSSCKKDNKIRGNMSYEEWLRHPHYLKVAEKLSQATRQANLDLVPTLVAIPRVTHIKSR